jgi:arylsulfatase A-like enzyme
MSTRRGFLASTAAAAFAKPPAARPNVVLILTDDQGYGDLGCHGNAHIHTPNIDGLAREGVELTDFHVSPVCSPTRSSLLTGRYNYRTGVVDTYLGRSMMYPDEVTLAEMLSEAGYATGIFGKWHLGDNYPMRSIDQGFRESLVCTGGGLAQPAGPPGNGYFDPVLMRNGTPRKTKGYCSDIFTNEALKFIVRNLSRPFFVYLAYNAPHTPLQVKKSDMAMYRDKGLDMTTAAIYAMVSNIDENVGEMLGWLKKMGLDQNTIVIFMTDNGPQQARYNAGMLGLKGSVYEGGIRVPCFIRWPGKFEAGRKVGTLAAHIDMVPTLVEACGVKPPRRAKLDGASLLPLLRGEHPNWPDRTLYFQWHRGDQPQEFRNAAAVSQHYKLVEGRELYDRAADPGEQHDIAAAHPEIVAAMRQGYQAWFRDVSATRGYAPPRIHLGSLYETPTTLTRQDWRGPQASWEPDGLGYWEVQVEHSGEYMIGFRFRARSTPGEAILRIGGVESKERVFTSATSCGFDLVRLKSGPARLEAILALGGKNVGVDYVDVLRVK